MAIYAGKHCGKLHDSYQLDRQKQETIVRIQSSLWRPFVLHRNATMPLPDVPRYDPVPLWLGRGICRMPLAALESPDHWAHALDTSLACGGQGVCVAAATLPAEPGHAQAFAAALQARALQCVLDLTPPPTGWDDTAWGRVLGFAAQVGAQGLAVPPMPPAHHAQVMARLAMQPPRPRPWVMVDTAACPTPKPAGYLRSLWLAPHHSTGSVALALHARIRQGLRASRNDVLVWRVHGTGALAARQTHNAQAHDPVQAHLLDAVIGSCLRGAHWLALAQGPDAQMYTQRLGQFNQWRAGIAALRYGSMALLPPHPELLAWVRQDGASQVVCIVNLSAQYVRHALGRRYPHARMLAGSGLHGGRLVNTDADLAPWGALFLQV